MASQTFTHASPFNSAVVDAWVALQDAATWGSIGGVEAITDPHHDADGRLLSYSFSATVAARRYPGRALVRVSEQPNRMVVDIDTLELSGSITVGLAPASNRGIVTVELFVRSKGLLSGMMFPLIATAIGSGLSTNVEAFARSLGGGESV